MIAMLRRLGSDSGTARARAMRFVKARGLGEDHARLFARRELYARGREWFLERQLAELERDVAALREERDELWRLLGDVAAQAVSGARAKEPA